MYNSHVPSIITSIPLKSYKIIDKRIYYVLEKEEFEKNGNNGGALVRIYSCYDGLNNQEYAHTVRFTVEGASSLSDVKSRLRANSDKKSLQLKPHTIVSPDIIKQWNMEGYSPIYEYYKESPEGLTYENLLK
jgi:hypothetical protein